MINWDQRFLDLAKNISIWSKDPSTKCGAVIVRPDKTVASLGYNGFPRGINDSEERLNNRETKLSLTVHCEINAILSSKESVEGYTLYTWPYLCCDRCASHVIQAGIIRVVAPICSVDRWQESINKGKEYFKEAGVEVLEITDASS